MMDCHRLNLTQAWMTPSSSSTSVKFICVDMDARSRRCTRSKRLVVWASPSSREEELSALAPTVFVAKKLRLLEVSRQLICMEVLLRMLHLHIITSSFIDDTFEVLPSPVSEVLWGWRIYNWNRLPRMARSSIRSSPMCRKLLEETAALFAPSMGSNFHPVMHCTI